MRKRRLSDSGGGMPLLEGRVAFTPTRPEWVREVPRDLSEVEYASIALATASSVVAVRGRTATGATVYVIDRDTDGDLSSEGPVVFEDEGGVRTARLPVSYRDASGAGEPARTTELVLTEPKPRRIEYHFDEWWEATLAHGGEQVSLAVQRFSPTILFLDANASGAYDKIFYAGRETLGLGRRFFRVAADLPAGRVSIEETDREPVDTGHAAPDFAVRLRGTDRMFRLSEHKGEVVVLTFWHPGCPQSKANAALFSALAKSFAADSRVTFIAVIADSAVLDAYLEDHEHAFAHVVDRGLWDTYGVSAPFPTFVIDGGGTIVARHWGFTATLEGQVRALVRSLTPR